MRILMTADAAGGVGVFADELAAALLARGHQVLVVVFSPTQPAFTPGLHRLWAPFRLEWMDDGGDAAAVAADARGSRAFLADLAQRWRPDLMHSNHFAYVGAVVRVPTLLSVHSDVVSWWRTVRGTSPPENAFQRWYRVTAQQALEGAGGIVTPSRAAQRDLLASFGGQAGARWRRRLRVIVNGRNPASFRTAPKQALALAVGRLWDAAKQPHVLNQLKLPSGMELAVAGEGRHPMAASVARTPTGARHLGQLTPAALADWLARARAYVGTSLYEPFGLAALEAALCGCVLVLNDIPSWRELWGAAACFYANRGELEALLQRVVADPLWAAERGQAAWRHAHRRYTAARMAQTYEAAYRRLL